MLYRMGDVATHANIDILRNGQWFVRASIVQSRSSTDKDVFGDCYISRYADFRTYMREDSNGRVVPDDAVCVDDATSSQSGVRADVSMGTNEAPVGDICRVAYLCGG